MRRCQKRVSDNGVIAVPYPKFKVLVVSMTDNWGDSKLKEGVFLALFTIIGIRKL